MGEAKGGYTGRTLRADLDHQRLTVEETPDGRRWLGPRGWNALVGWNEVLPGVGPSRAQAIVEYRERHPFRRVEDLLSIRGIGRATLNHMLPYVVVEGETTLTRAVPGVRRPTQRQAP